jgi:hypothetical protein
MGHFKLYTLNSPFIVAVPMPLEGNILFTIKKVCEALFQKRKI